MSFIRGTEYANKLNSWHNNLEEDRQQRASSSIYKYVIN